MIEAIIHAMTKSTGRKSLYHFTRERNLASIAHFDVLWSSYIIHPSSAGERRAEPLEARHSGFSVTINAHLKISDRMIDPSVTQEQFRACLDRHVFFWPTKRDCMKMIDTYTRREPDEGFAVMELDAYSLILAHYPAVKLSKYDSGSSPRFPHRCSYKKSLDMFLPIARFQQVMNHDVPTKSSEIKEVLVEGQVVDVTRYLRAVYVDSCHAVPERWRHLARQKTELQA